MSQVELLAGDRQSTEKDKAVAACNDYLRMGPGRSLQKLWTRYQAVTDPLPPTRRITTLKEWSSAFGWQERATFYDSRIERKKTEQSDKRRQQALESGFALDYERVLTLKKMASLLLGQLYEKGENGVYHNLWVPDVKQIGGSVFAERVDIERFNAPLISEIRGLLDDLAKETGGRKQKVDVTWRHKLPPNRDPDEVLHQFASLLALAAQKDDDSSS